MELGLPQGQPDWFQKFSMESGPQQGQSGYYFDQWQDIANQYGSQLSNLSEQYGQKALYNPAFLQAGKTDYSSFNPFEAQSDSGSIGKFDWEWNPFSGLQGIDQGIDYLDHYITHDNAVVRGANAGNPGDVNFMNSYGLPQGQQQYENTGGQGPYESMETNQDLAFQRARQDRQRMLELQRQYGY